MVLVYFFLYFFLLSCSTPFACASEGRTKPCFSGICHYDYPKDSDFQGTLTLMGDAISDITSHADWHILECEPGKFGQDIRLVCLGDEDSSGCKHLLDGGAVGKLVRLPENCGKMPFARVAKIWPSEKQEIPEEVGKRLSRRDDVPPLVQGMKLDLNFSEKDPFGTGVRFLLKGTTLSRAGPPTGALVVERDPTTASQQAQKMIGEMYDDFANFDGTTDSSFPEISLFVDKTIFEKAVDCPQSGKHPAYHVGIRGSIMASLLVKLNLGVVASGTVFPPAITDMGIAATITASFDTSLNLIASITVRLPFASETNGILTFEKGELDTGVLNVGAVGVPGLVFPGIYDAGPRLKLGVQAKLILDASIGIQYSLTHNVVNYKYFHPETETHRTGGDIYPKSSPLVLQASPFAGTSATLEFHVIPSIEFGIDALGSIHSNVGLGLDMIASAQLSLRATPGGYGDVLEHPENIISTTTNGAIPGQAAPVNNADPAQLPPASGATNGQPVANAPAAPGMVTPPDGTIVAPTSGNVIPIGSPIVNAGTVAPPSASGAVVGVVGPVLQQPSAGGGIALVPPANGVVVGNVPTPQQLSANVGTVGAVPPNGVTPVLTTANGLGAPAPNIPVQQLAPNVAMVGVVPPNGALAVLPPPNSMIVGAPASYVALPLPQQLSTDELGIPQLPTTGGSTSSTFSMPQTREIHHEASFGKRPEERASRLKSRENIMQPNNQSGVMVSSSNSGINMVASNGVNNPTAAALKSDPGMAALLNNPLGIATPPSNPAPNAASSGNANGLSNPAPPASNTGATGGTPDSATGSTAALPPGMNIDPNQANPSDPLGVVSTFLPKQLPKEVAAEVEGCFTMAFDMNIFVEATPLEIGPVVHPLRVNLFAMGFIPFRKCIGTSFSQHFRRTPLERRARLSRREARCPAPDHLDVAKLVQGALFENTQHTTKPLHPGPVVAPKSVTPPEKN